jgi:hypothetical protein
MKSLKRCYPKAKGHPGSAAKLIFSRSALLQSVGVTLSLISLSAHAQTSSFPSLEATSTLTSQGHPFTVGFRMKNDELQSALNDYGAICGFKGRDFELVLSMYYERHERDETQERYSANVTLYSIPSKRFVLEKSARSRTLSEMSLSFDVPPQFSINSFTLRPSVFTNSKFVVGQEIPFVEFESVDSNVNSLPFGKVPRCFELPSDWDGD